MNPQIDQKHKQTNNQFFPGISQSANHEKSRDFGEKKRHWFMQKAINFALHFLIAQFFFNDRVQFGINSEKIFLKFIFR